MMSLRKNAAKIWAAFLVVHSKKKKEEENQGLGEKVFQLSRQRQGRSTKGEV